MARIGRTSTLVAWQPSMAELLGSDFTLIGAVLAGLALTSLGILHDLGPLRLDKTNKAKVLAQGGPV